MYYTYDDDSTQHKSEARMSEKLDDEVQRLNMVVPTKWVKRVDDWRRREPDLPNLSEAIRRLVEMGLESAKKGGKGR
jgi:rRNA maturation endonuclease Nob1